LIFIFPDHLDEIKIDLSDEFYILIRLKTPYFSALISRTPYFSQANLLSSDSMHYFYDTFNLIS